MVAVETAGPRSLPCAPTVMLGSAGVRPGYVSPRTAPVALAITPNGRMIYVVSEGSSTVTPIATATNRPGTPSRSRRTSRHAYPPITVGGYPVALALTG